MTDRTDRALADRANRCTTSTSCSSKRTCPTRCGSSARPGCGTVQPPEDRLVKAYVDEGGGDVLVDLIFRPADRPVTREQLGRAEELRVDSVLLPVESGTDILLSMAPALSEHFCDLARLFPHARALREQIDRAHLRAEAAGSPFARAFLALCGDTTALEPVRPVPGRPPPGRRAAGPGGRDGRPVVRDGQGAARRPGAGDRAVRRVTACMGRAIRGTPGP